MACWGKRAARVCLAEMGMRRAWSEREPGSRCRKKGGPSVAARPTREAQWESILRAFIQPHKFTFVMNKLHDRPDIVPGSPSKAPGAECPAPRR